jgi:hypothetical protein
MRERTGFLCAADSAFAIVFIGCLEKELSLSALTP